MRERGVTRARWSLGGLLLRVELGPIPPVESANETPAEDHEDEKRERAQRLRYAAVGGVRAPRVP